MSFLTTIGRAFLEGIGPIETRSAPFGFDELDAQWAARYRRDIPRPWRSPSVSEAMGVPSIFGAVSLIANTVGTLSLEAYRRGSLLSQDESPRLMQRPNPFTTLRVFLRDTTLHLATRGEAWWWIAVRDPLDGTPMSLYPVPPWEITLEQNDDDRLRPTIRWGNRFIPNDDIRQITYLPGRDGRGSGPLQECGAAVSVAVEAQAWAANFFSGAVPSIVGTTEQDMTADELKQLDAQWNEKPPNMPRWMTNGMSLSDSPFDPEKAQLTAARKDNVGDTARMFNMPGALIEYAMDGSSITYQNQQDIWSDFARRCLSPGYLEPIEQEISDLLSRSTVARFNLKQLLRADPKTRMEVHNLAIPLGIYDAETAAREEGYAPGNVDYAPVPAAPPQAQLPAIPTRSAMDAHEVRCPAGHLLAELASPPYRFTCFRCKRQVAA